MAEDRYWDLEGDCVFQLGTGRTGTLDDIHELESGPSVTVMDKKAGGPVSYRVTITPPTPIAIEVPWWRRILSRLAATIRWLTGRS